MSEIPVVVIFLYEQLRSVKAAADSAALRAEEGVELFRERPSYILPVTCFVRENPPPFETMVCHCF